MKTTNKQKKEDSHRLTENPILPIEQEAPSAITIQAEDEESEFGHLDDDTRKHLERLKIDRLNWNSRLISPGTVSRDVAATFLVEGKHLTQDQVTGLDEDVLIHIYHSKR